jgi:hypothetical protein
LFAVGIVCHILLTVSGSLQKFFRKAATHSQLPAVEVRLWFSQIVGGVDEKTVRSEERPEISRQHLTRARAFIWIIFFENKQDELAENALNLAPELPINKLIYVMARLLIDARMT